MKIELRTRGDTQNQVIDTKERLFIISPSLNVAHIRFDGSTEYPRITFRKKFTVDESEYGTINLKVE